MKENQAPGPIRFFILPMAVCLLLSNIAFAEETVNILPDDPLYAAKRHAETTELAASSDPLEKARIHTKHAKERLAEANITVSKGKPEFVEGLMGDYENSSRKAMANIKRAANQGRDVSEALNAVEGSAQKHTEVLTGLLGKVPEQATPSIERAIEVSKRGRNRALESLNKVQGGKLPISRPEGRTGKPEGIDRPEASGRPGGIERSKKRGGPEGIGRPGRPSKPSDAGELKGKGESEGLGKWIEHGRQGVIGGQGKGGRPSGAGRGGGRGR
ncbi:MAG: DUF5667 domain-containing protein [Candidatus Brocadiales bacterium]